MARLAAGKQSLSGLAAPITLGLWFSTNYEHITGNTESILRKFGSADGLGIFAVLDALAWWVGVVDPLTGIKRSRYYLGVKDLAAADAAAEEVRRVQALYPEGTASPALVKEQSG